MSQILLIDEAWSKLPAAEVKRAGYVGVLGYISHDQSKCLTRADVDSYHGQGLGVGFVFEDGAQRALSGHAGGLADGAFAASYLDSIGHPRNLPAYTAVDFQPVGTQMVTAVDYVHGFATGAAPREGRGYGDTALIDALVASGIAHDWQTCAWSNGVVNGKAAIYQRLKATTSLQGSFDEDVVIGSLADVGLWFPQPTRRYRMLVFAQGLDATTALAVCAVRRVGVATTSLDEAKAAIGRSDKVLVIGGPAAKALALDASVGKPTAHGSATVAIGATAEDTLQLALQLIH